MKNNISIVALILAVLALTIALMNEKRDNAEVATTEITTREAITEEIAAETITNGMTSDITAVEETELYENSELFEEIEISPSDLPFIVSVDSIKTVKMYIPRQPIGDEDVWENTYIDIECTGKSEKIAIKFDSKNGILTGNIIPQEEMIPANFTYIYLDGKYSQDYILDRDGTMLIFAEFPENLSEIEIFNRSSTPIFVGKIDGKDVVVNDIFIHLI